MRFEVFWSNAQGQIYYGPAPLNDITIAPGVTGNISIEIARNPIGPFNGPNEANGNPPGNIVISTNGASILARANLRRNGGPADICLLKRLRVGVLGNPDNPADVIDFDLWDGSIIVGVNGQAESPLPDHGDLLNIVRIRGVTGFTADNLTIRRDLVGELIIEGHANRRIIIQRDLLGTLHIKGDLPGATGDPDLTWHTRVGGDVSGELLIDGSLRNGFGDEVLVEGDITTGGAITVDHDGFHATDTWESLATVHVGSNTYSGNSPAVRVYRVTECRGDMNNDGIVDTLDDDGFARSESSYVNAYPGLAGSWYFHADCNQDSLRWSSGTAPNADDEAAYAGTKLSECCITACNDPDCPGDVDKDGDVDINDLAHVVSAYGLCGAAVIPPCANIDGSSDGCVGLEDVSLVIGNYGLICDCGPESLLEGGSDTEDDSCELCDPDFVEWIRSASVEEILAWFE